MVCSCRALASLWPARQYLKPTAAHRGLRYLGAGRETTTRWWEYGRTTRPQLQDETSAKERATSGSDPRHWACNAISPSTRPCDPVPVHSCDTFRKRQSCTWHNRRNNCLGPHRGQCRRDRLRKSFEFGSSNSRNEDNQVSIQAHQHQGRGFRKFRRLGRCRHMLRLVLARRCRSRIGSH